MTVKYKGQTFMTDNDLTTNLIGFYPGVNISDEKIIIKFAPYSTRRTRCIGEVVFGKEVKGKSK